MDQNEEFDDEDYYHKDNAQNQYEKFFSIDPSIWEKYGSWLNEQYPEFFDTKIYFFYPSTKKDNTKQHIIPKIRIAYENHIEFHINYFLSEPSYYKSLYEILN